jgi:nucleoside-diphosphate-sugar epimerase
MSGKICAITGSSGYVGGSVKKYFTERGWGIFELTRRPKPNSRAVQFQLGDDVSPQSLSGVGALVHCAYDFMPLKWNAIAAVNVEGSRKILEAARTAGIPKIIFISSISAFDGCKSLYGRAKLEIEKIALANGALVIRPGLVWGNPPGAMFGRLVEQIRGKSVIPMIGDGSQIQFLVHNEDLCAFIEQFSSGQIQLKPQILTAANERPWPFKQLLREIARELDRKPRFIPLPWRFVWLGLKCGEVCGLKLNFRSDSLVSLMHQNPAPDFSANPKAGLICRPFIFQTRTGANRGNGE